MDAKPRPVCRAAKQLLAIVDSRPLIDLSEAHPALVKYHKVRTRRIHAEISLKWSITITGAAAGSTAAKKLFADEVLFYKLPGELRKRFFKVGSTKSSVFLQNAAKLRILQYLNRHQHFVEGADMYSLAEVRHLNLF